MCVSIFWFYSFQFVSWQEREALAFPGDERTELQSPDNPEWNFQSPVSLKEKGRTVDILEVSDSNPHPALCRRTFFNSIWKNAPCAACFTTRKGRCESLQESNAPVLNWTLGFPFLSIKAICWRDGGLCRAVSLPPNQLTCGVVWEPAKLGLERHVHTKLALRKWLYHWNLCISKHSHFQKKWCFGDWKF